LQQQTGRRLSLSALDKLNAVQQGIFDHQQLLQTVLQSSPLAVNFLDADGGCGGYLTHPGVIFPSSRPSVVMVQPTKNWNTNDGVMGLWFVYSN
jgi:hypothetical protein